MAKVEFDVKIKMHGFTDKEGNDPAEMHLDFAFPDEDFDFSEFDSEPLIDFESNAHIVAHNIETAYILASREIKWRASKLGMSVAEFKKQVRLMEVE